MNEHWERLGCLLKEAREARDLTQVALGEAIGVKRAAVGNIEAGASRRVTPTLRAYARHVGWTDSSIDDVLAGGEPSMERPTVETVGQPREDGRWGPLARVPERLVQELIDGVVVDTDVLDLTPDGSAAVLMLVIERDGLNRDPQQVAEDLRAWSRKQREIRRAMLPEDRADS
jgi:DNA-binding XRE family transcriptional regulator